MHDAVAVHMVETLQQSRKDSLDLRCRETAAGLNCVEESFPLEQFEDNIDRIIRLVNSFEAKNVGLIFCIQLPEDCKLVDQALFAILGIHY
jgi:uncharacterized metal-binding protein